MYEFKMPSLGADMEDAKLLAWRVKPGDRITKGDIICEIETRKSAVEVESFRSGIIEKILKEPGEDWLAVGTPLAMIREE